MVTKQVNLNVWEPNNIVLYANRGEIDVRYIEASFKNEDQNNINLANYSITFYVKKPDDTMIFNYCTVDTANNTVTAELTSQALSVPGILECEFQIFDSDNELLKVTGLKIIVAEDADFSEAIESTSEFNALISAINEAQGFSQSIGSTTNLATTNKNTLVEAINEVNSKSIGYVLYSNDNGTSGTVTLSESVENFKYIDIFFKSNGGYFSTQTVYDPNGKSVNIFSSCAYSPTNTVMTFTGVITLADTSVTWNNDNDSFFATNTSNVHTMTFERNLSIYKIVGYKN